MALLLGRRDQLRIPVPFAGTAVRTRFPSVMFRREFALRTPCVSQCEFVSDTSVKRNAARLSTESH